MTVNERQELELLRRLEDRLLVFVYELDGEGDMYVEVATLGQQVLRDDDGRWFSDKLDELRGCDEAQTERMP